MGTPTVKEIRKQGLEHWNEGAKTQLMNYVMHENRQLYCPAFHPIITQYDVVTEAYFEKFNPVAGVLQKKTLKITRIIMAILTRTAATTD